MVIQLPEHIHLRLNALAKITGRNKTTLVREAICAHLDDLEDFHLAEARTQENRATIPLDEVERQLGING